jgi:hypothetical protein
MVHLQPQSRGMQWSGRAPDFSVLVYGILYGPTGFHGLCLHMADTTKATRDNE